MKLGPTMSTWSSPFGLSISAVPVQKVSKHQCILEGTKKEVWFTYTWGHSYHRYYCKRPPLHCQQFCMPCCLCLDHSASTVCTFKPLVVCHLYWIPVKCLLILYWLFTQGQQICSNRFVGGASQLGHILFRAPPFMLLIVPYIYLIILVSMHIAIIAC